MSEQQLPIPQDLLELLRCPVAVHMKDSGESDPGKLRLVKNSWLVNDLSGNKYPIRNGIPVMLPEVGAKYKEIADDDLPVPPPNDEE